MDGSEGPKAADWELLLWEQQSPGTAWWLSPGLHPMMWLLRWFGVQPHTLIFAQSLHRDGNQGSFSELRARGEKGSVLSQTLAPGLRRRGRSFAA